MAGRADKRASNNSTQVGIPQMKIFSLHPPAKIREQDMKRPSNFDSNFNLTLELLIIVVLQQLCCDCCTVLFVGALKSSLKAKGFPT